MTRMKTGPDPTRSGLFPLLALLLIPRAAPADDWPGWRGERRDGVWRETGILRKFPSGGPEVKWRAPIGPGFSGPSVALGRVYATDRVRERGLERVLAYDARDGKQLWVHEYPVRYHGVDYDSGPRATPLVVGGRVYALGTMGHLNALDAASGKLLWSKDLEREYSARIPGWGIAGAPLAEGRLLIVNAGGEKEACLLAFDLESGAEVWRALKDPPGYSAPVVIESGGARQLIFWSARSVSSLDPLTGKLYWREEFRSNMDMSVATPMLHRDVLFVSSFYSGALALRLDPSRPAAVPLYRSERASEMDTDLVHCLISTPCFRGDHLYAVDSYGQLRCLEVATGKRVWETLAATGKARWSNVHLVPNGDVTFLFNEHGELIIADLSPAGYREIDRTKLIEPSLEVQSSRKVVWSHPAFAGRSVFVRNDREILCASLSAQGPDPIPAPGPKSSGAWIRPSWPEGWQEGKPVAGGSFDVDLTEFLAPGRHAVLVGAP